MATSDNALAPGKVLEVLGVLCVFSVGGFVHHPSFQLLHCSLDQICLIHPHPNFSDFLTILITCQLVMCICTGSCTELETERKLYCFLPSSAIFIFIHMTFSTTKCAVPQYHFDTKHKFYKNLSRLMTYKMLMLTVSQPNINRRV